jgi:N-acetylmuramoyl-L-alanine amidase
MAPTGQAVLQLATQHLGEAYHLGMLVPKDNPAWTGPWDCAEFASWLIFQTSDILYGCNNDAGNPATADAYTGFWDQDARNLGHIVPIEEAARIPGAAILRVPPARGIGHVVISDGKGGTVEAHSANDGVVALMLSDRRWDMGILVPGIEYSRKPPVEVTPPTEEIYRLRMPPMFGDEVRKIQRKLKEAGFSPGAIDGVFGPHTRSAVVAFQLSAGLVADGEVGPVTAAALKVKL